MTSKARIVEGLILFLAKMAALFIAWVGIGVTFGVAGALAVNWFRGGSLLLLLGWLGFIGVVIAIFAELIPDMGPNGDT